MEGRFFLDGVGGKRMAIVELLAREDEALLVGRDALLVVDLTQEERCRLYEHGRKVS
jgi:hypothetical protein